MKYIQPSRSMNKELGWSTGFHVVLVLAGMFYLPLPDGLIVPDYALPVELITIDEFTRLTSSEKAPEDPKKVAAVEPSAKVEAPAPVTPPVADAMPSLDNPKPATSAEALVNLVTTPRPLSRPTSSPQKRKALLDTSHVRALLDKTPTEVKPQPKAQVEFPQGETMSLSEIDAFRAQMQRCWSVPAGAANADDLAVSIRVGLARDGSIAYGPYVIDKSRISDPYFRAAAESVLRAIRRCQPFQMPPEKYNRWRELELNFDPKQMLRG